MKRTKRCLFAAWLCGAFVLLPGGLAHAEFVFEKENVPFHVSSVDWNYAGNNNSHEYDDVLILDRSWQGEGKRYIVAPLKNPDDWSYAFTYDENTGEFSVYARPHTVSSEYLAAHPNAPSARRRFLADGSIENTRLIPKEDGEPFGYDFTCPSGIYKHPLPGSGSRDRSYMYYLEGNWNYHHLDTDLSTATWWRDKIPFNEFASSTVSISSLQAKVAPFLARMSQKGSDFCVWCRYRSHCS